MSVKVIGKHEKDSRACRDALALTLNEMMAEDKSIVYVDCDLMGCINTKMLRKNYPDRAFEAGIAEANGAGVAAGLAAAGKKVFFHSFGTFSSRRCYDQIYMSAAYAGLTVHVLGSDAGVTAAFNGGTHMPFEDMALYRAIPGAVVGAFLIGICENIIKALPFEGATTFVDAFTFALLIIVLVFKPTGIFGEKATDKV